MADYSPTNPQVRFTKNDIGATAGAGKYVTEQAFAGMQAELTDDFVSSGMTLPSTSGTLNIDLALGVAYVSGFRVSLPSATTLTVGASTTSYVFLRLDVDADGNVNAVKVEVNTTGTAPARSIPLATITSAASTITATADRAPRGRFSRMELLAFMDIY